VIALGSELEGPQFWAGVSTVKPEAHGNWIGNVAAVVQPAVVEERPRHLLVALAGGIPVIATPGCGLTAQDGVTLIPASDAGALVAALEALFH
jgi:glycosyltransferase involved in cell wall biosynthesis